MLIFSDFEVENTRALRGVGMRVGFGGMDGESPFLNGKRSLG